MNRYGFGVAGTALAAAVASVGLVVLLDRGGIWRGMEWHDATGALVWCLCGAAALAGAVGGRLLSGPDGGPSAPARRLAATAAAGLALVPAAVLAVAAGRDRDYPDVVPLSRGHYVGFAALGVALGLAVVWTMLAVPALGGPVLAWYGWVAALLAALALDAPGRTVLPLAVLAPVALAGLLSLVVARAGRPVPVAAAAGVSTLLILAAARWLVAAYWFGWYEQNAPCRVTAGECQSTYLMYELFLLPVLLLVPAVAAAAGAGLGHLWHRRRAPSAAGSPVAPVG